MLFSPSLIPRDPGLPPVPAGGASSSSAALHAPTPDDASRWGVLRHRHYRNVIVAQFISNCGNWMEMVGLQLAVAQATGSLRWAGILTTAQLAPLTLFGVFGGVIADRVERRNLLVLTQALLMLAAAAVAVIYWLTLRQPNAPTSLQALLTAPDAPERPVPLGIYLLCLIGGVQGLIMAVNTPAWQVLTPNLVPRDELIKAITVNGIQFNFARVIGPAFAALIVHLFHRYDGVSYLFILNSLSFSVVVFVVATTPRNPPPPRTGSSSWGDIWEATLFLWTSRGAWAAFMATAIMSLFAAPLIRYLAVFAQNVYSFDKARVETAMGWFLALQGIGAVIGGLTLRKLPRWYPLHHLIPFAIVGNGLFITLFAVVPVPAVGYAIMCVIGFFWIWAFNQSWAALQRLAPDAMRGRVMAMAQVAAFGLTFIGALAGGYLGDGLELLLAHTRFAPHARAFGTQGAVVLLALSLLAAGLWMLTHRVPEIDLMPPAAPDARPSRNLYHAIIAKEHQPQASASSSSP